MKHSTSEFINIFIGQIISFDVFVFVCFKKRTRLFQFVLLSTQIVFEILAPKILTWKNLICQRTSIFLQFFRLSLFFTGAPASTNIIVVQPTHSCPSTIPAEGIAELNFSPRDKCLSNLAALIFPLIFSIQILSLN